MRVWDIPVDCLCELHAEAEHRSCHAVVKRIAEGGFFPPEAKRWHERTAALASRHDRLIEHGIKQGWQFALDHDTPLVGKGETQPILYAVDSLMKQVKKLDDQVCGCKLYDLPGGPKRRKL